MEAFNQFIPILALAVLTERIVEVVFDILETYMQLELGEAKRIWTFILSLVVGVTSAFVLNLTFFAQIGIAVGSETNDTLFTGLVAGAIAPYSHQLVELLFKVQKAAGRVAQPESAGDQETEAAAPA